MPRCIETTAAGKPCRARAIRGSDPPRCAFHSGHAGAPPGNQNARRHGFYAQALDPAELADLVACADDLDLDDEIAMARVVLRRLLGLLETQPAEEEDAKPIDLAAFTRVAGLALQATRTISRLLRDKRALSGEAADGIAGAIAQALDELSTEWGVDL